MNISRISLLATMFALTCVCLCGAAARDNVGQQQTPVEWFKGGVDETGADYYYAGQKETGERIVLTPNECYFSGGRLRCFGDGPRDLPEPAMNGTKSFTEVGEWNDQADQMRWHIWCQQKGIVNVTAHIAVDAANKGGKVSVQMDDLALTCTTSPSDGKSAPQPWKIDFRVGAPGYHAITLQGVPIAAEKEIGRLLRIDLTGPAIKNASVLRSRWRPAAIHAGKFTNSEMVSAGENTSLWVMEMRPTLDRFSVYAPVTTPFGYFGSTFSPNGSLGGVNFSMWSYGRGKEEPPLIQQSRLLAVGSAQAIFSGFGHEGTGVKVRGWNPYEGLKLKKQALALRVEWGDEFSTYYGYFLDPLTHDWRLYAVGRKPAKSKRANKSSRSLSPGSFVEVPGPPDRQRTGDAPREVHFRGWSEDSSGKWRRMDTMNGPSKTKGIFNKIWRSTEDGWFSMLMGGMKHYKFAGTHGPTVLPDNFRDEPLPDFLDKGKTTVFRSLPAEVTLLKVAEITDSRVRIPFDIRSGERHGNVQIFWGTEDCLTFADRWKNSTDKEDIKVGRGHVDLTGLKPDSSYSYRVLFRDANCQVWSFESGIFRTRARE
jgi:hypothetical protein